MGSRKVSEEESRSWRDNVEREERLRLKWFRRNEKKLVQFANQTVKIKVTDDVKKERIENYKQLFQGVQKHPQIVVPDAEPRDYDPEKIMQRMLPIDPDIRQLLYTGTQRDGRQIYLHARQRVIPEKKYYFPETTNFRYGWKMWDHAKNTDAGPRFGKSQIVKQTFYRRRGVVRDPEWYKEPIRVSPTVCDCV